MPHGRGAHGRDWGRRRVPPLAEAAAPLLFLLPLLRRPAPLLDLAAQQQLPLRRRSEVALSAREGHGRGTFVELATDKPTTVRDRAVNVHRFQLWWRRGPRVGKKCS
jgi:hypothetical protein